MLDNNMVHWWTGVDICIENIAEIEEKWTCPNCGEKMQRSPDGSTHTYVCPECGCSIDAEDQNFDSNGICPNCNHNNRLPNKFCTQCGFKLSKSSTVEPSLEILTKDQSKIVFKIVSTVNPM